MSPWKDHFISPVVTFFMICWWKQDNIYLETAQKWSIFHFLLLTTLNMALGHLRGEHESKVKVSISRRTCVYHQIHSTSSDSIQHTSLTCKYQTSIHQRNFVKLHTCFCLACLWFVGESKITSTWKQDTEVKYIPLPPFNNPEHVSGPPARWTWI